MEICEKNRCTGCQACMNICPMDAISFHEDLKGFLYPEVSEKCVGCNACQRVCPRNTGVQLNQREPVVYAAFTKNKATRKNSSSGGMFTELAKSVLEKGGIIYASKLSEDCKSVVFDSCNTVEDLAKFQGSKYVQSQPGLIFRQVKETLLTGREVLFIGVPCQVDGLKKYLNKEYSNLLVVDIICHGVPSPKLWRDYCTYLEEINGAKAVNISYRYKKPNWTRFSLKVDFDNNKSYVRSKFDDPYLISFLKEISMRENCYSCEYTSTYRTGDITLADFWGYHSYDFKMRNTEKGISLVMINTEKGQIAFENIKSEIVFQERTIKEAIGGNRSLKEPWKKNPVSEEFWHEYIQGEGMKKAFEEYDLASSSDYIRDMRINEKLGTLLTLLMEQSWHPESMTVSRKRLELASVKVYLDEHYTGKIALDDLSEHFFINKFYLSKIFKETYGTTVNNYLISKRITRAKQLLRFTDMTVDEVGAAVGMGDANYFSRMFRKVEGISPREYRKQW